MRFRISVGAVAVLSAATALSQAPARTPTPAPRLSGGFGRPRNTPAPTLASEGQATPASDVVNAARSSSTAPEKSSLTIDNRSLVKNPSKGRVSTSRAVPAPARPSPTAATVAAPPTPAAAGTAGESATSPGTEAEWKEIAARARKRVADDRAKVQELSAATKKLENDFYAW
ncbi:MAG: hypothetical protein ACM3NW_01960, partial [Syntrophomonadaceae bacterium]